MENNCELVSSRGLLKSCDVHVEHPTSSSATLPDLNTITNNSTVYVCNSALHDFAQHIQELPFSVRFVLVSGDSDNEVSANTISEFIENPRILHWFCQNATVNHRKLTNLPIGLDYHTFQHEASAKQQEYTLQHIRKQTRHFTKRKMLCYINFSLPPKNYAYRFDREEALKELPTELCSFEKPRQKRTVCWQHQSECAFVVSPFGNGIDCHRTWEALVLGCIPIVRTSGIDPMYNGLPVLIVQKWSDVTETLLRNTIEAFEQRTFQYQKLTLYYWVKRIESYKKNNNISIFITILLVVLCAVVLAKKRLFYKK